MQLQFTPTQIARFWSRVDFAPHSQGCWLWAGAQQPSGYGHMWIGTPARMWLAHRVVWALLGHTLSPDVLVCHHCDNQPCVRPSHLFSGSQNDNMRDMLEKQRHYAQTHDGQQPWSQGERHYRARLTDTQAREILQQYDGKRGTLARLAREYGVNHATIWCLVRGYTWRHLG